METRSRDSVERADMQRRQNVEIPEFYVGELLWRTALQKLEGKNPPAVNSVRNALERMDRAQPGFLLELLRGLLDGADLHVNLQESFLRLQADMSPDDLALPSQEAVFVELSQRAVALRKILARIPDEIGDRRAFLETIKEIANSIKKLLDATNKLFECMPPNTHPSIEQRKREFVKYSKRFSNTLKDYFKGENANFVYVSANQLIYQTCLIVKTVRDKTR